MEKQDLIKKIEEISLPEIEIASHKEKLKNELLENYFQKKKKWEFFVIFRKLAFATLNAAVFISVFSYIVLPQYSLAKTERIVFADPQIKKMMEGGNLSSKIEIVDNKSYVLISPTEEGELIKVGQEEFAGILVEVNLREKRIEKINKISPQSLLNEKEKEKAEEIIKANPEIKNNVPEEAEISEIKSIPSQLQIIKKGKEIEVSPKDKKATVIYRLDEKKWEGKVNLIEEKVEKIDFSIEENESSTTNGQKEDNFEDPTKSVEHPTTTGQENLENEKEKTSPNSSAMPERLELK